MNSVYVRKPDIIIVDDHQLFRQGIRFIITKNKIGKVIGEASNGKDFIDMLSHLKPDLILMDIEMPVMNGIVSTKKAFELMPDLKIIAFTMFGDKYNYYNMITLGVKGFLLKSSSFHELEMAINTVMKGENYFSNEIMRKIIDEISQKENPKHIRNHTITVRENEVLQQICFGLNNDAIAEKLCISPKTVKTHKSNLLKKSLSRNIPELILFAMRNKLMINIEKKIPLF
jgi:DNA-binding NarL/FixJ family response regulator